MHSNKIALYINSVKRSGYGVELGRELDLSIHFQAPPPEFNFVLELLDNRLQLQWRKDGKNQPGPIFCEFTKGTLDFRRRFSGGKQILLKAIGGGGQTVVDFTSGLGSDSFILASHDCHVTAVERSAIVFSLFRDGVYQAIQEPGPFDFLKNNLSLVNDEASDFLKKNNSDKRWDVGYLDPMFPTKSKTSLPKKEMALLQEILIPSTEGELEELLHLSRQACNKVVIKRPKNALCIDKPSYSIEGKVVRFDVYVK